MTQEGNDQQYQFREQPPTPAVVEALILELFQGKLTERKVIADEVLRVHLSRGGGKPRAQFEHSFRKALLTMKDAGLLYYLPAFRLRAEEHEEKTWPCKIGRTDRDPLTRVLSQAGTALPERPHLALVIRTDYPGAWEAALHGVLTLRGLRIDDLPGSEWFLTSPAEVLALVHAFDPQFADPKINGKEEKNSP